MAPCAARARCVCVAYICSLREVKRRGASVPSKSLNNTPQITACVSLQSSVAHSTDAQMHTDGSPDPRQSSHHSHHFPTPVGVPVTAPCDASHPIKRGRVQRIFDPPLPHTPHPCLQTSCITSRCPNVMDLSGRPRGLTEGCEGALVRALCGHVLLITVSTKRLAVAAASTAGSPRISASLSASRTHSHIRAMHAHKERSHHWCTVMNVPYVEGWREEARGAPLAREIGTAGKPSIEANGVGRLSCFVLRDQAVNSASTSGAWASGDANVASDRAPPVLSGVTLVGR